MVMLSSCMPVVDDWDSLSSADSLAAVSSLCGTCTRSALAALSAAQPNKINPAERTSRTLLYNCGAHTTGVTPAAFQDRGRGAITFGKRRAS